MNFIKWKNEVSFSGFYLSSVTFKDYFYIEGEKNIQAQETLVNFLVYKFC